MNLTNIQNAMQEQGIDCWVIYDFQGMNPIMSQLLRTELNATRRVYLIIPTQGDPCFLGSKIDRDMFHDFSFEHHLYVNWQALEDKLKKLLAGYKTIALDYTPNGVLPTASRIDAGNLELIRSLGKTIVSSADILQAATAVWGEVSLNTHLADAKTVARIKDEAFALIGEQLQADKAITEYDVQTFIMNQFEANNLFTNHPPIVSVNGHSGDPHYSPTPTKYSPIQKGDWILIDLWAKKPGYENIFVDITWVGFAGLTPPAKHAEIFKIVAGARDAAVDFIETKWAAGEDIEGWQADDAARNHIIQAGYGDYFFHRTGHSLGPGNHGHGPGANLDNLETHDTRKLTAGIGFTIEPGIYLPEFGVRSEIDIYMAETGPQITTPVQQQVICLDV